MKQFKVMLALLALVFSGTLARANSMDLDKPTDAQAMLAYAERMENFDKADLQAKVADLPLVERIKLARIAHAELKAFQDSEGAVAPSKAVLYILAIFIPPLAVGLATDWQKPTLFNLLWTFFFGLPGIIHAFIVISRG